MHSSGAHNFRQQVFLATKLCTVATNIYGTSSMELFSSGAEDFQVVPKVLENVCKPSVFFMLLTIYSCYFPI